MRDLCCYRIFTVAVKLSCVVGILSVRTIQRELCILRKIDLQLNSDEYKYKLKIVNFLKKKGLDYYNEPIPDFMIKRIKRLHPNDWQEYMQKY